MAPEENKALIRNYIQAIDANKTSDWSIVEEYLAEDFVAHNPPFPGVGFGPRGHEAGL